MVRRSNPVSWATPVAASAAALALFLVLTGCAQVVRSGLGLLGIHQEPSGLEGRSAAPTPPARVSQRPPTTVGGYESAATYGWERWAVASPVSFSRFMSQGIDGATCSPSSPGLARVLPVGEGSPAVGVQHLGPFTFGLAGPGTAGLREFWRGNGIGFAQAAMQESARQGTYTDCQRGVFAFVTLGGGSYDPVVVR
jgi:hypothetical protein